MFKNYSLAFKWFSPFEKVSAFPSDATPLLSFDKGMIAMYMAIQLGVSIFLLLILYGKVTGSFEMPLLPTLFFTFVLLAGLYNIIGGTYQIIFNKTLALARDDQWLYLDELHPKRVKISDIKEAVVFGITVRFQTSDFLYFKMKDGRSIGRIYLNPWPYEKTIVRLEQQGILVVRK